MRKQSRATRASRYGEPRDDETEDQSEPTLQVVFVNQAIDD
jgi:hypothetical protein